MLITISGPPGSGTTTASRRVAAELGLELLPGGEVFRALAAERGMTLREFGRYAAGHPAVDVEFDTRLAERARRGGVVIESRLAGWIAKNERLDAVIVLIDCDPRVRAERVAQREGTPVARALAENAERERIERERYLAVYGIDIADRSVYDLVLDSGRLSAGQIAARVSAAATARFP